MSVSVYRTLFSILLFSLSLCCHANSEVASVYEEVPIDQLDSIKFSFNYPNANFSSDCFYTIDVLKNRKPNLKFLFHPDTKGETPRSEFENRIFEYEDIIYVDKDHPNKGAFILLKRDDEQEIVVYLKPFKKDKRHNPKQFSFSDLFIKSDTIGYYGNNYRLYHSHTIPIKIVNHSKLQSYITELCQPYIINETFGYFDGKVKNYNLDRVAFENGNWTAKFNIDGITATYDLDELAQELENKRLQIKRHETILADNSRYDIRIDQLRELINRPLWYRTGFNRDLLFYRFADDLYPSDNDWEPGIHNYSGFSPDTIFWMNAYPLDNPNSGRQRVASSNLLNQWNYDGVACIIEDIIMLPNYYGFIGDINRASSSAPKPRKNGGYQHSDLGDNEYAWYVVLKQNPAKLYQTYHHETYNPNVRVLLLVDDLMSINSFVTEDEFMYAYQHNKSIEQADIDEQIQKQNAREYLAITKYGKDIARIICSGQVRFGFTPEMCEMAFIEEPYRESLEDTPFGQAVCYNFFNKELKLFFISDELIGIQFRLGKIRYKK